MLEVVRGRASAKCMTLEAGTYVLGRSTKANLVLEDDDASRTHAKLVVTEEGLVNLIDLGSTNGTRVNGQLSEVAILREGDRIEIGTTVLRLAAQGADTDPSHESQRHPLPLSARELDVARLVAEGLTNVAIASRLKISPRTVATHLERAYERLGIHSRAALSRLVAEHDRSSS